MIRRFIIIGIVCATSWMGILVYETHVQAPLGLSFETLFRVLGKPIKTVDRFITRLVHVSSENEQRLGDFIALELEENRLVILLDRMFREDNNPVLERIQALSKFLHSGVGGDFLFVDMDKEHILSLAEQDLGNKLIKSVLPFVAKMTKNEPISDDDWSELNSLVYEDKYYEKFLSTEKWDYLSSLMFRDLKQNPLFEKEILSLKEIFSELEGKLRPELTVQERYNFHLVKDRAVETENYLQALVDMMVEKHNPKNLKYRVFLAEGEANAFALPGGLITVTTGLVDIFHTEAQMLAVLGHEKGHIELGHCIDSFRFLAKSKNIEEDSFRNNLRSDVDRLFNALLGTTYSKTQEYEADLYGYETLLSLGYDLEGQGQAHIFLQQAYAGLPVEGQMKKIKKESTNFLDDYFMTHPSSEIRTENFINRALRYKMLYPLERFYVGKQNYEKRKTRIQKEYPAEYSK